MSSKVFLLERKKKVKNPLYIRLVAKYSSTSAYQLQSNSYSMNTSILRQNKEFCLKKTLKFSEIRIEFTYV